ncbi:hypothetical protein SAMN06295987_10974 [Novosphingobium mathurense]|uniref:Uncharacterized protein n=1 Tax=Novosphingobium mathurense TaxID=428990 RepID=A0A1U6IM34_9SPHN|nr:hypothetical protein SAMN06295987_10974 [Novosphingobium mathurense]
MPPARTVISPVSSQWAHHRPFFPVDGLSLEHFIAVDVHNYLVKMGDLVSR